MFAAKRARTTESTPDTSMLCGPVSRSWGKTEWIAWGQADEAHFEAKNDCDEEDNPGNPAPADPWSFHGYLKQRDAAIAWAAPSHVKLRVLVPQAGADEPVEVTVQVARDSQQPVRAILDGMCATASLRRDDFFWTFTNGPSRGELVTATTGESATERGKKHDLCRATDRPVFPQLIPFYLPESWESEHTFCRTIIAIAKPPPPAAPPAEEPAWPELNCPPPDGAASEEEWDEWQNDHSYGGCEFWTQYWDAVRFRCPPSVPICLKGLTHSLTLEAVADAPLENLLAAFCAAAPTPADPMSPGDLLLMNEEHSEGAPLDAQCTSARSLFTGPLSEPLELDIVYRDTARAQAELASKLGPVPAGYRSFRGGGYLVACDNDTPWLVSDAHGVAAYNRVVKEALDSGHAGDRPAKTRAAAATPRTRDSGCRPARRGNERVYARPRARARPRPRLAHGAHWHRRGLLRRGLVPDADGAAPYAPASRATDQKMRPQGQSSSRARPCALDEAVRRRYVALFWLCLKNYYWSTTYAVVVDSYSK